MNRLIRMKAERNQCFNIRSEVTSNIHSVVHLNIMDMPHAKSLPIFGTRLQLLAAGSGIRLHEYIDNRHKKLGPLFYEKLDGSTKLVFISDPAIMKSLFLNLEGKYPTHLLPDPWVHYEKLYGNKRGLFFMNGEEWLSNRRVMNKYLLRNDVEKWIKAPIQENVFKFVEDWKNQAKHESFLPNLEADLYQFSTNVIIAILLGTSSIKKSTDHILLQMFSESVKRIFQTTTKLYGLPIEWYQRFNLKEWRDFRDSVDMSLSLANKLVREILDKKKDNNGLIKQLCEENLSDEIITRIIADFVIAAGDTTAYTSLWILYLLSNNIFVTKEIQNTDQEFVKLVIKEAMRLYPAAPFLTRILPKESILGPYKLDGGTPVIASIYTSGRDEKNFSSAEQFIPYRWDRNDSRRMDLKNHVPPASLPFALGARSCIGKKIAMMQMNELIYQIVNNFNLKCLNERKVKPITSQVLIPSEHIKICVSLRRS